MECLAWTTRAQGIGMNGVVESHLLLAESPLVMTKVAESNIRKCEHWKSPTPGIYHDAFGGFDGTCI